MMRLFAIFSYWEVNFNTPLNQQKAAKAVFVGLAALKIAAGVLAYYANPLLTWKCLGIAAFVMMEEVSGHRFELARVGIGDALVIISVLTMLVVSQQSVLFGALGGALLAMGIENMLHAIYGGIRSFSLFAFRDSNPAQQPDLAGL